MTMTTDRENRFGSRPGAPGAAASGTARGTGTAEGAPAPANRRRTRLIVLLAVVLVAVGAGGYLLLRPTSPKAPTGGDVVVMDAMTLSLAQGHYLKIQVAIQLVAGEATASTFETSHAAELVIDTFSNRTVDSLADNAARKRLAGQLLGDIQHAYPGKVFDLYLTQFVLQ
jgi:flagellar FliL protein